MFFFGVIGLLNYMAIVSYDGSSYHGFQLQKNALTVQEVLEKSLEKLYGQKIKIFAAGRTDSGVHARGQVINFFAPENISAERIPAALNALLPDDIVVVEAKAAEPDFHARRDAKGKIYSYTVDNGAYPDVFSRKYAWHIREPLDVDLMRQGASFLLGRHDFKAFQASGSPVEDTKRTLYALDILLKEPFIIFRFRGDGFLYKMVRNITGTLVEVGLRKKTPQEVYTILKSKDRCRAGITAPARGLCLEKVYY